MTTAATFDPVEAGRGRKPNRRRQASPPVAPAPRPRLGDVAVVLAWLGFGLVVGLAVTAETTKQLRAAGGLAMFAGNVTGLAGTYLALVMVLLVSRIPAIERAFGQDGLLRWHRRLAPWPLSLIAAHVFLLTLAYAELARTGFWHEIGTIVGQYPYMIGATVGFLLMMAIGVLSIHAIRRRIPRERWWAIHLFMYLALALSFSHVIVLGPSFVGHPFTRVVWILAWLGTAGVVLVYRFGLPVVRSVRHRLQIVEVRPEAPGVVSVIMRGRHLERLAVSGGQFFEWRFLTPAMWWQAHPFSLSARPIPPYVRITVKGIGDFSKAVARLKPGTRVAIEGPYGAFTSQHRRRQKVALIAGGIGVTAVRALLEDLPRASNPVVVLRASSDGDLVLSSEVAELARQKKGRVHELVGSREQAGFDRLAELVPDLRQRDVYVCGPESFVHAVLSALGRLGVPEASLHYEVYAL